jgi:hypothetical protein
MGDEVGCVMERVNHAGAGERNFHVLYYICAGSVIISFVRSSFKREENTVVQGPVVEENTVVQGPVVETFLCRSCGLFLVRFVARKLHLAGC